MNVYQPKTPEEQWDEVKNKIFKKGVPKDIEELMKKGFDESEDESEKQFKLLAFIAMIKHKYELQNL